jgi:hypothetical protein
MDERTLRGFLATLGAGVIVAGMVRLPSRPGGPASDFLILAIGLILFLWSLRGRLPASLAERLARRPGSATAWLLVASVLLSTGAAVASNLPRASPPGDHSFAVLLWIAAILAFLGATAIGPGVFDEAWIRLQEGWREWTATAALTLLAAALRFYRLGSIPAVIDGDEGLLGMTALGLKGTALANPFASVDNVGGWYLRALAATIDMLGRNPQALRFLSALGGALAVPAVVLLARRLFSPRVALYAGAMLAVSHAHVHFSRISSVLYILGTFFGSLELWLLVSGLQRRSWRRLGLCGLVLGLHSCVYLDALMMGGAILLFLVGALLFARPFLRSALSVLPALPLGLLVAALPGAVWAAANSDTFLARFTVDGTFQSGWLSETAAETGQSIPAILAGRVAHAFLALLYYPATDFYGSASPLLGALTAAFFLMGLLLVTTRPRDPSRLLVATVFWTLTAMVGLFALPPSADSYRMIVTLPLVMICAAVGMDAMFQVLGLNRVGRAPALAGVAALVLLPLAAWNLYAYFGRFAGRCLFWGDPTSRISSHLGRHVGGLPPDAEIVLLADEHVRQGLSPSLDFLSGGRMVRNWAEPAASLPRGEDMVLIAAPSRVEELENWARQNPGGSVVREYECQKLLFATYRPPAL